MLYAGMLGCWVLGCWDVGMPESWDAGMLGCWDVGCLDAGLLYVGCWDLGMLVSWDARLCSARGCRAQELLGSPFALPRSHRQERISKENFPHSLGLFPSGSHSATQERGLGREDKPQIPFLCKIGLKCLAAMLQR